MLKQGRPDSKRKQFDIPPPVLSPAEDLVLTRMLERLLGRSQTNSVNCSEDTLQNVGAPARRKQADRHRPGRKPLFARIDPALHQQIQHFLVNEQMDLQTFVEVAATHFMRSVETYKASKAEEKLRGSGQP